MSVEKNKKEPMLSTSQHDELGLNNLYSNPYELREYHLWHEDNNHAYLCSFECWNTLKVSIRSNFIL